MYTIQEHKHSIYGAEDVEAGTGSLGISSQRLDAGTAHHSGRSQSLHLSEGLDVQPLICFSLPLTDSLFNEDKWQ